MELVPSLDISTRVHENLVIFARSYEFSWKSSGPVYQDVTTKAGYIMQAEKTGCLLHDWRIRCLAVPRRKFARGPACRVCAVGTRSPQSCVNCAHVRLQCDQVGAITSSDGLTSTRCGKVHTPWFRNYFKKHRWKVRINQKPHKL